MTEKWLHCGVGAGMFTNEAVVQTSGGKSFFVNVDQIQRGSAERGKVRVRTFTRGGATWAILPTEDIDVIQVQENELDLV